jgi:hypothetical protein
MLIIFLYLAKTNTLHKNTEALLDTMISGEQKVQRRNIQAANTSFGYVTKCTFLETTLINQNFTQETIKNRLNLGNACNRGVRIFLLPENIKIYLYKFSCFMWV